jgi:hypothetical protein
MPARQGFQFDPMAAKAQIGYGAAQVVDPGYGQIIDADAKRRQLELAEAKYKKEQEDKNKPSLIEAGKLVPALVPKAQEAIADYYQDYRDNSHTWDNATKMEKEANIKNFIQSMKTASDMAFEKNKAHDPSKLAFNQEMVENMFNADYLSGKANDEIDWTAIFGGINANYEIESINMMDRIKSLTGLAGYNADDESFEWRNPDNTTTTKKREEVTNDLAKQILSQDYKQMNAVELANIQHQYDNLSPKERKKYSTPEEFYIRDENSQLLAYKKEATQQAGTPDDDDGSNWKSKKYSFAHQVVNKLKDPLSPKEGRTDEPDYEEIRLALTDASDNKKLYVTDPESAEGEKVYATPISVRRRDDGKGWMVLVEEKVVEEQLAGTEAVDPKTGESRVGDVKEKGKVKDYRQFEIPWDDVSGDIKANFGQFDPDEWMEATGTKSAFKKKEEDKSSTTASKVPAVGAIVNGYEFLGGDPKDETNWKKVK